MTVGLSLTACSSDNDDDRSIIDAGLASDTSDDANSSGDGITRSDTLLEPTTDGGPAGLDIPQCNTDAECDDGLFCNGAEQCQPGFPGASSFGCLSGAAPTGFDPNPTDCTILGPCNEDTDDFPFVTLSVGDSCSDGIACTGDDICIDSGACQGTPNDSLCDDGLFCNGLESCSTTIGCIAGLVPVGTDSAPGDCLVPGPCEEATDSFAMVPAEVGLACDDSVDCTVNDACTATGTCVGEPDNAFCSDDLFCNGQELCVNGLGCQPANGPPTPPEDTSDDDCFAPTQCNEETDAFDDVPLANGTACDDGVACTTDDQCQNDQSCIGIPDSSACDDGVFCNGGETCDPTEGCLSGAPPSPPVDTDVTDCIAFGLCNEQTGGFDYDAPAPIGTPCDDGTACTEADLCSENSLCIGTPNDSLCDDDSFCNGTETCDASVGCQAGTTPTPPIDATPGDCLTPSCDETTKSFIDAPSPSGTACNDGISCTTNDACNSESICSGTPDDELCSDGLFCNGQESCDASADCISGTPPAYPDENENACLVEFCDETLDAVTLVEASTGTPCDDGFACTNADACDGLGACLGTADDTLCDDGKFCNGPETCSAATGCQTGIPPEKIDAAPDDCLEPTCDETTDTFVDTPLPDGTACDDQNSNTSNDVCTSGICIGGTP